MPGLIYQGQHIEYTIERKKVKHINLRISADGQVKISAPKAVSKAFIASFVEQKASWIADCLQRRAVREQQKKEDPVAEENSTIWLLGKPYRLQLAKGEERLEIDGQTCTLFTKKQTAGNEALQRQLRMLYKKLCSQRLPEIFLRFSSYQVPYPKIKLRKMKRCWGTCQTQTAIVTMNTRLIHAPLCCTDYILAHEIAHLVHPNHSAQFYQVLGEVYPKWQEHKQLLSLQHLL